MTAEAASADLARLLPMAVEEYPGGLSLGMLEEAEMAPDVHALEEDLVGDIGQLLWVLLGSVGVVLLIACVNVANLFLVRAESRHRETALRTAVGASRWALTRGFLLEGALLALVGGTLGLLLTRTTLASFLRLAPPNLPRANEIGIDGTVLLFTLAVSALAGLVFGLIPMISRGTEDNLVEALRDGSQAAGTGATRLRFRQALVAGQISLALILLISSGLMIRSLSAMRDVSPGFERPEETLTFRVSIPEAEISDPVRAAQALEKILYNLEALPGVSSVGASYSVVLDGYDTWDPIYVEGFPVADDQLPPMRRFKWVLGDYFATMQNPVIAGRSITIDDVHAAASVAMITETFAREYWSDPSEAVGKRISQGGPQGQEAAGWQEVVGVVGDVYDDGPDQDSVAIVYFPMVIDGLWGESPFVQRSMAFAVRSETVHPLDLVPGAREAVWSVNRNLPLASIATLEELYERSMVRPAFTTVMLAIAAVVALLLGVIGLYGVVVYVIDQRAHEIGVRRALGARPADVSRMMVQKAMTLAAIGVVVGIAAATGLSRLLSSQLFGIASGGPDDLRGRVSAPGHDRALGQLRCLTPSGPDRADSSAARGVGVTAGAGPVAYFS